jgi:hypothetical protein
MLVQSWSISFFTTYVYTQVKDRLDVEFYSLSFQTPLVLPSDTRPYNKNYARISCLSAKVIPLLGKLPADREPQSKNRCLSMKTVSTLFLMGGLCLNRLTSNFTQREYYYFWMYLQNGGIQCIHGELHILIKQMNITSRGTHTESSVVS